MDASFTIADDCIVYLNTNDFFELNKKINAQNLLVDKLKLFTDINRLCGTLQAFDSLLNLNEKMQAHIKNNRLHFALYKNLNWLLTFNVKQLGEQKRIEETLIEMFHAQKTENETYAFYLSKTQKVFFRLNSGITMLSDSFPLLQTAFDAKAKKLKDNKNFIAFKNTIEENSLLNVYINHEHYAESKAIKKLNLSAIAKKSVSAANLDFQPSQITINGLLNPDTSEVISLLLKQKAQSSNFTSILPLSTVSFTAFGFTSFSDIEHKSKVSSDEFWQEANDSAMYNLKKDFYENIVENLIDAKAGERFVLAKVKDTVLVLEHLHYMSDSLFAENSETIFRLKKPSTLFAPLSTNTTQYAAPYGQYLFFSESKSLLFHLLQEIKSGNVMDKNWSFVLYKNQNFPEAFNFLMYASPNLLKEQMQEFFNFSSKVENNSFENFKHFSFCAISNSKNFKFRCNLRYEAEVQDETILWTLDLSNPSQMQPYIFINHKTNEHELLIQDQGNILYLINAKGTVLWKKQLEEKIMSPIYMVDAVRNKKCQMLFNTKHHIHLIDRTGKYLNNYPVKLPAEATSPLALLDYDNDKDYRLLIACKNKTIYNYGISGNRQEHFTPVKTEHEVNLPVQYVKVGLSDYLVTIDRGGKIYTFSRRGAGRIGLKNQSIENCAAFYVDATNNINSTYLFYVDDKNNLINKISFADKKEIIQLHKNISGADIIFDKVGSRRNMDMIITAMGNLRVYSVTGNLLFEKSINAGDSSTTRFYGDATQSLFTTWDKKQEKIFVYNQLNQSEKTIKATALPLVIDLFSNKKYLIVVNGTKLSCQLSD